MTMSRDRGQLAASLLAMLMAVGALAGPAGAWHGDGHAAMTRLAVRSLEEDIPEFFRQAGDDLAAAASDPDLFRRPAASDALHAGEAPEHFFDLELLEGRLIPPTRYEFIALCAEMGLRPEKVGLLPYAIVETTSRLAVAFAQHRRWSDDPLIRYKCLVYASLLAHYAQDLCQPLHVTIHYSGRVQPDGTVNRTDIHQRMDALVGKLPAGWEMSAARLRAEPFDDLLAAVVAEIHASHALVDTVYDLEANLPPLEGQLSTGCPTAELAMGRALAGAHLTARLYATAWRMSGQIELPSWAPPPPSAGAGTASAPTDTSANHRRLMLVLLGMGILGATMVYRRLRLAREGGER